MLCCTPFGHVRLPWLRIREKRSCGCGSVYAFEFSCTRRDECSELVELGLIPFVPLLTQDTALYSVEAAVLDEKVSQAPRSCHKTLKPEIREPHTAQRHVAPRFRAQGHAEQAVGGVDVGVDNALAVDDALWWQVFDSLFDKDAHADVIALGPDCRPDDVEGVAEADIRLSAAMIQDSTDDVSSNAAISLATFSTTAVPQPFAVEMQPCWPIAADDLVEMCVVPAHVPEVAPGCMNSSRRTIIS